MHPQKKERVAEKIFQNTINNLEKWTREGGIRLFQEKTVTIKINKCKRGSDPQLTLYNKQIKVVESTRYLGLVVDSRLSWKQQVENLRQSCIPAMNLIKHPSHLRLHGRLTEKPA